LDWDLRYNANSIVLHVIDAGLPGDYNHDGSVDAADYVVWRKTDGSQAGYNAWRANFGTTRGPGSGSALPSAEPLSAAVPEPGALTIMILATVGWCLHHRHAAQEAPATHQS
jgi:hypothetical protein